MKPYLQIILTNIYEVTEMALDPHEQCNCIALMSNFLG